MSSLAVHQLITPAHTRPRTGPVGAEIGSCAEAAVPPAPGWVDNCTAEPRFDSLEEAMRTRAAHTGHLPLCHRYLVAIAYLSGLSDDADHCYPSWR